MPATTSPVQRLFDLLSDFKRESKGQPNLSIAQVWAAVFGLDLAGKPSSIFLTVVDLQKLAEDVRSTVSSHPDLSEDVHLGSFNLVERLFAEKNLDRGWGEHAGALEHHVLTELRITAHTLSRLQPEEGISEEELDAGREELVAAYAEIEDAELPEDIRRHLRSVVDAMSFAMSRYRTAGADAFWEAWKNMFWLLKIVESHPDRVKPLPPTLDFSIKKVWGRAFDFAKKAEVPAKTALLLKDGVAAVVKLLGDGDTSNI